MATRRLSGIATSSSVPDNGGDHSGGGGGGTYVDDVFSTYLYEGNSVNDRPIVNGIDLAGEGGLVWIKCREANIKHRLHDTERGVNSALCSNETSSEESGELTSFNSDGFSLKSAANVNTTADYASWTFRKAPNFFDVVTYTGDGSDSRTLPHNLNCEVGSLFLKRTDDTSSWSVYHRSTGIDKTLLLEGTGAAFDASGRFGDSPPTESTFDINSVYNENGGEYVAYLFAHDDSDESMIKCGSFDTNSSGDATVDLGFEPQFVITKLSVGSQGGWFTFDDMRGIGSSNSTSGSNAKILFANASDAEKIDNSRFINVHSNGFSARMAGNCQFVYMAIRRPNKPADEFEADDVFAVDDDYTLGDDPRFFSGFPVDFAFSTQMQTSDPRASGSRFTQGTELVLNTNAADRSRTQNKFDYADGWKEGEYAAFTSWMWRRAPGFFDVVAYTGNGQDPRGISHNLGVEPEMIWSKCRTATSEWFVHVKSVTTKHNHLRLNEPNKIINGSAFWDGHNEDQFFVQGGQTNWSGQTHITYLFASVPGISKVGSYTGNGSEVEVDCGFTTGARWVLIKAASHTGDWLMTTPTSALNFMVALNTTDPMVGAYGLTPTPNGFKAGAQALTNTGGVEYIFYAIA